MRHITSLWLLMVATVCNSATAATPPSTDQADLVPALARQQFGPQAGIAFEWTERVLDVDLQDRAVSGERIATLLTQLALEDADSDPVLLRAIRIANGRAADELLLQDLTVPFVVIFSDIDFEAGLTFVNVNFARKVVFERISSRGKLFIDRSSFAQGLSIVGESSLALPRQGQDATSLHVNKTLVERDLLISGLLSDGLVEFYDNRIEPALRIEDAEMRKGVRIRDNNLADLLIYSSAFNDYLSIYSNEIDRLEIKNNQRLANLDLSQNEIQNMAEISDAPLTGESFQFAFNVLERELYFAPAAIADELDKVALVGNAVRGLATVAIPRSRLSTANALRLDLGSSTFEGLLRIRLSPPGNDGAVRAAAGETYCHRQEDQRTPAVIVDLTAVRATRFAWDLPLGDCRYLWQGSGFRYGQWVADGAERDPIRELLDWRRQISEPQSEALLYMSEHLRDLGRFTDSRNIIFEAKRTDYLPSPHCAEAWAVSSARFWDSSSCVVQRLRYWFLYTSGFGVKPEFGLYFLFWTWLLGACVYYPYSWATRAIGKQARPIVLIPQWLDAALDWSYRRLHQAVGRLRVLALGAPALAAAGPGAAEPASTYQPRRPGSWIVGTDPAGAGPPAGFRLYQKEQEPKDLSLWVFSLDAALPVVNLHAYDAYFPKLFLVRAISFVQHGFGWWIATSLLASLALL